MKVYCCFIDERTKLSCLFEAMFEVWDGLLPDYDHVTQTCERHVGSMFTDSGEYHQFWPLVESDKKEVPCGKQESS